MTFEHCSSVMTSPTGLGVRNDTQGSGYYRAKRGKRLHKGTDYICVPGQVVYAPIAGEITRRAYPYSDKQYGGVVMTSEFLTIKMFYFKVFHDLVGKQVEKGSQIGIAQDISKRYSQGMMPHIHLEVSGIDPNIFIKK